jgi:uncharacterized membrane protein
MFAMREKGEEGRKQTMNLANIIPRIRRFAGSASVAGGVVRLLTAILTCLTILFVAGLLFSAYSAFSWRKFALLDYGIYTNMIWNCGHGNPFRVLMDGSYLRAHLSFTLALLGPLFRVWDHPFLLSFVQWCMQVAGALIVWRTARRRGVSPELAAAILLFYVGYPFTQTVLLCEFHGVSLYMVLIPWLYYCLCFRKPFAWVPLLLVLGAREDAFLAVVPMLFYFALKDRCRLSLAMLLVSIGYAVLATTVLYEAINGVSLFRARGGWMPGSASQAVSGGSAEGRLRALLWVVLPILPFMRRGRISIPALVTVPLAAAMLSRSSYQHSLRVHYPAAVMACMVVAMVEAAAPPRRAAQSAHGRRAFVMAVYLLVVTLVSHRDRGFLPWGGMNELAYSRWNPAASAAVRAARSVPPDGALICEDRMTPFCANRSKMITWKRYRPKRHRYDFIFMRMPEFFRGRRAEHRQRLMSGEFGVRYFDGVYVVLERGAGTQRNDKVVQCMRRMASTLRYARTHRFAGDGVLEADCRQVRHWDGNGAAAPAIVAFGRSVGLPAGRYRATVMLRARAPRKDLGHGWGLLAFHPLNQDRPLVQAEVDHVDSPDGSYRRQVIDFTLCESTRVEPRATAGDAELWLDEVLFEKLVATNPPRYEPAVEQ